MTASSPESPPCLAPSPRVPVDPQELTVMERMERNQDEAGSSDGGSARARSCYSPSEYPPNRQPPSPLGEYTPDQPAFFYTSPSSRVSPLSSSSPAGPSHSHIQPHSQAFAPQPRTQTVLSRPSALDQIPGRHCLRCGRPGHSLLQCHEQLTVARCLPVYVMHDGSIHRPQGGAVCLSFQQDRCEVERCQLEHCCSICQRSGHGAARCFDATGRTRSDIAVLGALPSSKIGSQDLKRGLPEHFHYEPKPLDVRLGQTSATAPYTQDILKRMTRQDKRIELLEHELTLMRREHLQENHKVQEQLLALQRSLEDQAEQLHTERLARHQALARIKELDVEVDRIRREPCGRSRNNRDNTDHKPSSLHGLYHSPDRSRRLALSHSAVQSTPHSGDILSESLSHYEDGLYADEHAEKRRRLDQND